MTARKPKRPRKPAPFRIGGWTIAKISSDGQVWVTGIGGPRVALRLESWLRRWRAWHEWKEK